MRNDRRSFLRMAGAAPAAGLAGLAAAGSAGAAVHATAPGRDAFAAAQGDEFTFHVDALNSRTLRLVQVEPLPHPVKRIDDGRSFRLVFEAPEGAGLAQATYRVVHPRLGEFALFVSPNDGEGRELEAVFNLL